MPMRSTFEINTQIILLKIDGFLKGWILNITPLKNQCKRSPFVRLVMSRKTRLKNAFSKRICPYPLCTCFLQVDEKHAKPKGKWKFQVTDTNNKGQNKLSYGKHLGLNYKEELPKSSNFHWASWASQQADWSIWDSHGTSKNETPIISEVSVRLLSFNFG